MLVFDIGANNGSYSNSTVLQFPHAKIIAVEANPKLIGNLHDRFKDRNIVVINKALAETAGLSIPFYVANVNTISTASTDWIEKSRFTDDFSWAPPIEIETTSLDELIKKYGLPDSVKIDIEGYEYQALKGLNQRVPELGFEWAEESYEDMQRSAKHLQECGFTQFGYTFEDRYGERPRYFDSWRDLDLHRIINPDRKELWGMIWVK